jgi:hypothetical protein
MPAVVGMGSHASGHFAQEVTCHNCIGVGATDTEGRFGRDATGAHMADPAAQSFRAESALVFLQVHPEETQINAFLLGFSNCLDRSLIASPVPSIFYIFIHQVI